MSRTVTVGLVGCGRWCKNYHVPLLTKAMADRFKVVGVCDAAKESAQEVAALTAAPAFDRVEDLIAAVDPELVYVVTKPPSTHFAVARLALAAGKHVFMEKPMCETADQCDDLIELARRHRRLLAVHHNRRWEVAYLVARRVLADGLVGKPYYVLSNHPSTWCGPADLLMDWGIHIADQALRVAAPARPVEVSCLVRHVEDPATRSGPWRASVRFDNGLMVDLFQMLVRPGALPKWLVCGDAGS
ncbi:MAG: Gfo/Idh/MocA family oxidoreductase, partial [Planctomycetes bacterium]|nr:Gfo/Idh/MocA family oxidoreductase [Planctomycetota bacterium]